MTCSRRIYVGNANISPVCLGFVFSRVMDKCMSLSVFFSTGAVRHAQRQICQTLREFYFVRYNISHKALCKKLRGTQWCHVCLFCRRARSRGELTWHLCTSTCRAAVKSWSICQDSRRGSCRGTGATLWLTRPVSAWSMR